MKLKYRLNNVLLSSILGVISPLICAKGWQINDYPPVVTGSSIYIEPNVMLLLDSSGSMAGTLSGSEKKIEAAKGAITSLADDPVLSRQARLGLAKLGSAGSSKAGGEILVGCSADSAEGIKTAVNAIKATGQTPITEAYYEITRYFRGLHGRYYRLREEDAEIMNAEGISTGSEKNADGTYPTYLSPIDQKYGQCQENHIVVLTDGSPTRDGFKDEGDYDEIYPDRSNEETDITAGELTGMTDDQLIGAETLPDWNLNVADQDVKKYYLDDIALWAKTELDLSAGHAEQQPLITHTISYGLDIARANDMLERAAEEYIDPVTSAVVSGATSTVAGKFFKADTNEQMVEAFREILYGITEKAAGGSNPIGLSGESFESGFTAFRTSYQSGKWTGSIAAEELDTDQSSDDYGQVKKVLWNTADINSVNQLEPDLRVVITNVGNVGKKFRAAEVELDSNIVDFFRGHDVSGEGGFRPWGRNSFGTFVNSEPVFVNYDGHPDMVFVGGNDGMLHGFDAVSGVQLLAYIPGSLLPELESITKPDYKHRYFVDGSPSVFEIEIESKKRKVLVGGLNGGGRSIYALDITDPSKFSEANANEIFIGEYKHAFHLGNSFSQPQVVKFNDNKWYLVFGGGYHAQKDNKKRKNDQVAVFIVPFSAGLPDFNATVIVKSEKDESGRPDSGAESAKRNGMSTLTAYNKDGLAGADFLYGGDLFGNIWRLNIRGEPTINQGKGVETISLNNFKSSKLKKLFQACLEFDVTTSSKKGIPETYRPITSKLSIAKVDGKVMIFFGTGKDFEVKDNASEEVQSLYGIVEPKPNKKGKLVAVKKANLLQQSISLEEGYRVFSDNRLGSLNKGWFIELIVDGNAEGERVLYPPYVGPDSDLVIFSTRIYRQDSDENACDAGKFETEGWYYALNPATGASPDWSVFDTNGDGVIDSDDVKAGVKTNGAPIKIVPPTDNPENDPNKSFDGVTQRTVQIRRPFSPGRQSWQQLIRER